MNRSMNRTLRLKLYQNSIAGSTHVPLSTHIRSTIRLSTKQKLILKLRFFFFLLSSVFSTVLYLVPEAIYEGVSSVESVSDGDHLSHVLLQLEETIQVLHWRGSDVLLLGGNNIDIFGRTVEIYTFQNQ